MIINIRPLYLIFHLLKFYIFHKWNFHLVKFHIYMVYSKSQIYSSYEVLLTMYIHTCVLASCSQGPLADNILLCANRMLLTYSTLLYSTWRHLPLPILTFFWHGLFLNTEQPLLLNLKGYLWKAPSLTFLLHHLSLFVFSYMPSIPVALTTCNFSCFYKFLPLTWLT